MQSTPKHDSVLIHTHTLSIFTQTASPGEVAKAVATAIQSGYRHIDGALMYGNEHEVGAGIKDSGVPRDQIFYTSKVWCTYHRHPERCLDETLSKSGLDYVDLLLMQ